MNIPLVVSPQWLQKNLYDPAIQVIENGWIRDAYQKAHIDGAVSVPGHPYLKHINVDGEQTQHVMNAGEFKSLCHELGLQRDKHYILYDDLFGLFAARFWTVCRHYGLHNVSILDGSWRGWLDQGYPVSGRVEHPVPGSDVSVEPNPTHLIGWEELWRVHREPDIQIWDNRRAGEYSGEEQTANRRRGHIPGALHLEWTDLIMEPPYEGGPRYLKPAAELEQMLVDLGLRRDKTIITYCQSGNRAAFCDLVLEHLGFPQHRMYDGSMGEWSNMTETPLVSGIDPVEGVGKP